MLRQLNMRKTSKRIHRALHPRKAICTSSKMYLMITSVLLLSFTSINAVSIPFISDVIFMPLNDNNTSNTLTRINRTCQQCLCEFLTDGWNQSYLAMNCYPNQTCQFFSRFSITYKLQPMPSAVLYFLQSQFPSASSCCMPNITELIGRLKAATPTNISLEFQPSVFGYDPTQPNGTVVIGRSNAWMYRFSLFPLSLAQNITTINTSLNVALHNNQTLVAFDGVPSVKFYDAQTSNFLFSVNHPTLSAVRKMIFINDGQNMVVSAQGNQSLAIFDIHSPTNYTFQVSHPLRFHRA